MSPENHLVNSLENADLSVSDMGEEGTRLTMTAHRIGTATLYNLWRTTPDGTESRIMREYLQLGNPELDVFRDLLAELYVSTPQNRAVEQLLGQVNLEIDKA